MSVAARTTTRPEWVARPPLQHARAGLSAVTVDEHILAIGGFVDDTSFGFVESRRRAAPGRWRDGMPMPTPRDNFATAALDGRVYAIGGANENGDSDVVEIYHPGRDRWTTGRNLPKPRSCASAAVLGGHLYLAGGRDGATATADLFVHDLARGGWRPLASMPTARIQLRLVASGRHLYAIGGRAQGQSLTAVERYDPATDHWRAISPLRETRVAPGVVATTIGQRRVVVVAGGAVFDANGRFADARRTTEILDLETGRWRLLEALLPTVRASFGCAVDADGAILAIGGATHAGGAFQFLQDVHALRLG